MGENSKKWLGKRKVFYLSAEIAFVRVLPKIDGTVVAETTMTTRHHDHVWWIFEADITTIAYFASSIYLASSFYADVFFL